MVADRHTGSIVKASGNVPSREIQNRTARHGIAYRWRYGKATPRSCQNSQVRNPIARPAATPVVGDIAPNATVTSGIDKSFLSLCIVFHFLATHIHFCYYKSNVVDRTPKSSLRYCVSTNKFKLKLNHLLSHLSQVKFITCLSSVGLCVVRLDDDCVIDKGNSCDLFEWSMAGLFCSPDPRTSLNSVCNDNRCCHIPEVRYLQRVSTSPSRPDIQWSRRVGSNGPDLCHLDWSHRTTALQIWLRCGKRSIWRRKADISRLVKAWNYRLWPVCSQHRCNKFIQLAKNHHFYQDTDSVSPGLNSGSPANFSASH